MSAVWTLPQLPAAPHAATLAGAEMFRAGVTDEVRTILGKTLATGVLNGRLQPRAVRKAMARGVPDVLAMIAQAAKLPPLPSVSAGALAAVADRASKGLSQDVVEGCLRWMVALHKCGALTDRVVRRVAKSRDARELVEQLLAGWERFVEATVRGSGIVAADESVSLYFVAPAPLLRALTTLRGDAMTVDDDFADYLQSPEEGVGDAVVAYIRDDTFFERPGHAIDDPEFFAAFAGAWDAVACGAGSLTVLDTGSTDDVLIGMQGEALEDLCRSATWVDGEPTLSADAIEDYESEYGSWSGEDSQAELKELLKYRRAASKCEAFKPGSAPMKRWLTKNEGTAQAALVSALIALSRVEIPSAKRRRRAGRTAHGPGGAFLTCVVPMGTGMAEVYNGNLQCMYEETSCLALLPEKQNPDVLLTVAREVILGAAVASAAASHITEFYRAKPRRNAVGL